MQNTKNWNREFEKMKKDIIHFQCLANYQQMILNFFAEKYKIELIILYDEMLAGLKDLIEYEKLTKEQIDYLPKLTKEEKKELLEIYNEAYSVINKKIEESK